MPSRGNSAEAGSVRPAASACKVIDLPASRASFSATFFPQSLLGLWAPPRSRCVYIVDAAAAPRPIWPLKPNERLLSVQWAPDASRFAVTVKEHHGGWWVYVADRNGQILQRYSARGSAFVRDGRLVLLRRSGLYLVLSSGQLIKLASMQRLAASAGFPSAYASINEGLLTNGIGYGDDWVVMLWWQRSAKNLALAVSTTGVVRRASPFYGHGRTLGYYVGGYAWSKDGSRLFEMPSVPWLGPGFKDHDHCLDVWRPSSGFRRLWCLRDLPRGYRFHFDKLAWSPRGVQGILNNGTVISAAGRVLRRSRGYNGAFSIHWATSNR